MVAKYVNNPKNGVIKINGTSMTTFKTIGTPNKTVSLIKKKLSGNEIFPTFLNLSLFAKNVMSSTRPKVDPAPPKVYI